MLRFVVLDIPLVIVLLFHVFFNWVNYVAVQYLQPQFENLKFTTERRGNEVTYYARRCGENDITTRNGADLFLDKDTTAQEAYKYQLKHGFTGFKSVATMR
jgi:hypothetical protein